MMLSGLFRTEMPDGSYNRISFDPWYKAAFDQNDTLLEEANAWYAERMSSAALPEEQEAAHEIICACKYAGSYIS
jgi:hypothetical protein